jgi:hypothetical protein
MIDRVLQVHASRLLRDEYEREDITTLLLALRQRSGGREALIELGDFVAHRDQRFKGIVTRTVRDFFVSIRFLAPRIMQPSPINLSDLPPNMIEAMWATFRLVDSKYIKKLTGLKRQHAEKALSAMAERVIEAGGRAALAWPTASDIALINCLAGVIVSRPAFDGTRLYTEFVGALVENALVKPGQAGRLARIKAPLALYAVACMHECVVDLGDGTHATLTAGTSDEETGVAVTASSWVSLPDGKQVEMAFPIFTTSIPPEEACNPDIWGPGTRGSWMCPLELKANRRLGELS